jgi:hypothetical protein
MSNFSLTAVRMLAVLHLITAKPNLYSNHRVSLRSPDNSVMRQPICDIKWWVISPCVPDVSNTTGSKQYRAANATYLHLLLSSAARAANPAEIAELLTCDLAKVLTQVASQHKHLPLENGKIVKPSGFLPSPLSTPTGPRHEGTPAL